MRRVLPLLVLLAAALPARAESPASTSHAAWQSCLNEAFASEARTTGRSFAATRAVTACRAREDAYIVALSGSPMLDGDDAARIRQALVERARSRLIGGERRLSAL